MNLCVCVRVGSSLVFESCRMDLNDRTRGFSKSVVKDPRHKSVVFSALLPTPVPGSGVDTRDLFIGITTVDRQSFRVCALCVCQAKRDF